MPFLSKSHQRAQGASDRRGPLSRELCYSPTANDVSADMNDPIWPDYDEQGTPSMYVYVWAGASCMLGHGGSLEVCVKVKFFVAVFTVRDNITR